MIQERCAIAIPRRPALPVHACTRAGLTLVELILAIVCAGILLAMVMPKFTAITRRYRINEAAMTVATDLKQAVSLAARRQRPVTISLEAPDRYVFKDRAVAPSDTVRLRRNLRFSGDVGARTVSFSPASVTVYPTGTVDQALVVTVGDGQYARQVSLSAAGQVRVVPTP